VLIAGRGTYVRRITGNVKPDLVASQNDSLRGCYLPFATADGTVLAHCIVLKAKELEDGTLEGDFVVSTTHDHYLRCKKENAPMYFFFSKTGAVNEPMFRSMRLLATKRFELLHPGLQSLWIGDNASFQVNLDTLNYFLQNHQAVSLFTAASMTALFGILDDVPFAALTQVMASNVHRDSFYLTIQGKPLHGITLMALIDALKTFCNPDLIKKGFDNRFSFPLSGEKVLEVYNKHSDSRQPSQSVDFPLLDRVTEATSSILDKKVQETKQVRTAIGLASDRGYTTFELNRKADEAKQRKQELAAEKEAARLAKAEQQRADRLRREQDMTERFQQHLEQRAASLCQVCRRRQCGPKANWRGCEFCEYWVCGPCMKLVSNVLDVHETRAHQKSSELGKRRQ
jgi:hypothetical protein